MLKETMHSSYNNKKIMLLNITISLWCMKDNISPTKTNYILT